MKKISSLLFQGIFLSVLTAGSILQAGYIGYIYPAGARTGTTTSIIVAGQALWGIQSAIVTGGGVTVEKVESIHGFNHPYALQRKYVLDCFRARKNNKPLPSMPLDFSEWRPNQYYDHFETLAEDKLDFAIEDFFAVRNSLQSSPSIAQRLLVTLRIDANAKCGRRELRLTGRHKATNFLPFYITKAPEVREDIFKLPPARRSISTFKVPSTLHGQILPGGEKDSFYFSAKKGEKITFTVRARELVPFMGDCVPGHFQPIVDILERKSGKTLATADYNYFSPDPILNFTAPASGDYTLTIRDSLHRGRKDFVYLVEVKATGKGKKILPPAPKFPIAKASAAKIRSTLIKAPVMIQGVIAKKREKHSFTLLGRKGEKRIMKVYARGLGSPLDSRLVLQDRKGKIIAGNDDKKEEVLLGTRHHKADSELIVTFPEDGKYTLTLSDTASLGSPDHFYYLRIDSLRPDFEIVLAPSNLYIAPWGGNGKLPLTIIPKEGFNGQIDLTFSTGHFFFTGTNKIPAGLKEATLTAGSRIDRKNYPNSGPVPFRLVARSGKITKDVIPADKAMQAFAYTHFVPASELVGIKANKYNGNGRFSFRGEKIPPPKVKRTKNRRRRPAPPVRYRSIKELKIAPGKTKNITYLANSMQLDAVYSCRLVDPPKGVALAKMIPQKKEGSREVNLLPIQVGKDVKKGKYLLQFESIFEYDSSPDTNGVIHRRKYPSPMPTLLLEVQ